jgi:hypothetical protein
VLTECLANRATSRSECAIFNEPPPLDQRPGLKKSNLKNESVGGSRFPAPSKKRPPRAVSTYKTMGKGSFRSTS